jgi:hypothetical protein
MEDLRQTARFAVIRAAIAVMVGVTSGDESRAVQYVLVLRNAAVAAAVVQSGQRPINLPCRPT